MATALCAYEWQDWLSEESIFDVVVKTPPNKKNDFYIFVLHDSVMMFQKYQWDEATRRWPSPFFSTEKLLQSSDS